jgi:hypothetical protein
MKCQKIEKLLYLYRECELTTAELGVLNDHLMTCSSCRILRRRLENEPKIILQARKNEPVLQNVKELKKDVLRKILRSESRASDYFFEFLSRRRVRLAFVGVLSVIVLSFFVQEFYLVSRISRLESRLAQQSDQDVLFVVPADEILDLLKPVVNGANVVDRNKVLFISEKTIRSFLRDYHTEKILMYLDKKVNFGDGLDKKQEIEIQQKKALLDWIHHSL